MSAGQSDETERIGLGGRITELLDEHWPNSGVNGHHLADLLRADRPLGGIGEWRVVFDDRPAPDDNRSGGRR